MSGSPAPMAPAAAPIGSIRDPRRQDRQRCTEACRGRRAGSGPLAAARGRPARWPTRPVARPAYAGLTTRTRSTPWARRCSASARTPSITRCACRPPCSWARPAGSTDGGPAGSVTVVHDQPGQAGPHGRCSRAYLEPKNRRSPRAPAPRPRPPGTNIHARGETFPGGVGEGPHGVFLSS